MDIFQSWTHSFLPKTTPLSKVISQFNVTHHLYADDTHVYLEFDSRNFNFKLKLHPDKSESIFISNDQIRNLVKSSFPVIFLGNFMKQAESVKTLVPS